jgi:hypothetical protein
LQIFMYGGGANCSLCPGCPMGKGWPCIWEPWRWRESWCLKHRCSNHLMLLLAYF